VYFVIAIERSTLAPHQAPDKKYYKRYNFQSAPMDHYEIVDVGNRRLVEPRLIDVRSELSGQDRDVNLVVQNIGNRVARDLKFKFPDGFTWPSRLTDKKMPLALDKGVQYFPPDRRMIFNICSVHDLFREGSDVPMVFEVQISYLPE
jgi:hypothetical protein